MEKASIKINFFELLELPQVYNLCSESLEKNYLKLQKVHHPDNFLDMIKKNNAFSQSALINEGYAILKSPLARAKHLLFLEGINSEVTPSSNFLEEILDLREEAEELTDKTFFLQKISNLAQNLIAQFDKLFMAKDYELLRVLLCKLQYLTKISEELEI